MCREPDTYTMKVKTAYEFKAYSGPATDRSSHRRIGSYT